jgi:hypothetical protein
VKYPVWTNVWGAIQRLTVWPWSVNKTTTNKIGYTDIGYNHHFSNNFLFSLHGKVRNWFMIYGHTGMIQCLEG